MDSKTIVDYLFSLYDKLSWQRLGQVAVVLVMVAAGVLFYKNIDYLSGAIRPAKLAPARQHLTITDNGKEAIAKVLRSASHNISTIYVVSYYFERNTRRIVYITSLDPEITRQREEFERTHATVDVPILTDDETNNTRVIQYVNGEFVCTPFADSQAARFLSNVNVKTVCATGLPPTYGKFRGTLVALVKTVPDAEEQTRLKILMRDLSNELDNPSDSK